jgi:hypothetical protein
MPPASQIESHQKTCMSTQLSENTVKVKVSDLRERCRDLLEEAETLTQPQLPIPDDVPQDDEPVERQS